MKWRFFLVLSVLFTTAIAQKSLNPCRSKTTSCAECIQSHPSCAWCMKESYTAEGKPRCDFITLQQSNCSGEFVHPTNHREPIQSKPLSTTGVKTIEDVVQLAPQEVRLKLRPKEPFKLDVKFRQAKDYPLDLYYLMDLSKSMEDDKDKLASLGNLLAKEMEATTNNFRLGFGSFVDKTVMPYVSTVESKLREPCTGCAAPYGFRNHMSLNESTDRFADEVHAARVSGNLDAPEGGFDAIMQSVVCGREIGWREKARKMLVFSTDSGFHYAGDGKLGGIITPNDGACHLDASGYYTKSTEQDYPSLSQLRHEISDKKVNIIFAVTASQLPVYNELSKNIDGSYAGKLENDSSNVVQLIKEQYLQITSEVELKDNASSSVKVTYYSKCLGNKLEKTNICKGLKVGTNVDFVAEIEVESCPNDKQLSQTFHISPVGLTEALVVHLDMICECGCEKSEAERISSEKCNHNGVYECGVCTCKETFTGHFCECNETLPTETYDSQCRKGNSTLICSGRGTCSCGRCYCNERPNKLEVVTGPYCECDNFSCYLHNSLLCGGHGKCECGVCVCDKDYEGDTCQCPADDSGCIGSNGEVCSGHGNCTCGVCHCDERYRGAYCGDCPTCIGKCDEFKPCVQCWAFDSGEYKDNCLLLCSHLQMEKKEEVKVENHSQQLCVFKDESDDCKFTFVYDYKENEPTKIKVQDSKECPESANILAIILGVIGGIVAVGLCLLIIWKLLTTIHDRREFAKFEKERQMAKWDAGENPIYKQATSTFKNPTYGGKQ